MGRRCDWGRRLVAVKLRLADDGGQILMEYALTLALIAIVSIGVLAAIGADLTGLLDQVSTRMSSVTNP
jgi:Flp pilus assembly pilin Flp